MWIDNTYRVVLFGHRNFAEHNILDKKLYPILKEIFRTKSFVELYIGRNGEFDIYAASIVKRVQNAMGKYNNELICVLPYRQKDSEYFEKYYDRVLIPEAIEKSYPKGAITSRNRWMVEQADIIVCYVEQNVGGAYAAMKYAAKLKKTIINLAEKEMDWEY